MSLLRLLSYPTYFIGKHVVMLRAGVARAYKIRIAAKIDLDEHFWRFGLLSVRRRYKEVLKEI